MFMMARMWGDPKKVPNSPEAFWRLPGDFDEGTEIPGVSKEEMEELKQRFAKLK